MILNFPKNFYWGTATSAYQVEGGIRNDWSTAGKKFDAGIACDHYNRFKDDFNLAKTMNNNAHRFSIEWARIEPEEGKFDEKEIEHYRKVILALKQRGLEPFVTLYHWTLPVWLAKRGGWLNKGTPKYFVRYAEFVVKNLPDVKFWITINEPNFLLSRAYVMGIYPPFKKNILRVPRIFFNLVRAHKRAYGAIKGIRPDTKISFTQAIEYYHPARKWCLIEKLFARIGWFFAAGFFYRLVKTYMDYVAGNYYNHNRIIWRPPFKKNLNKELSDMGWEIYPEGIYYVLKDLKEYNKPIYITENGLADAKDEKRAKFIIEHLRWVYKAIQEGVDVRGYFHWSLIDNFEWTSGFEPRFGLIEIDYKTLERKPRSSSRVYSEICKNNYLNK